MLTPVAAWKRLPRSVRVRLILVCLLVLLGAEAAAFLPMILETAVLIDSLGVLFVLTASWSAFASGFGGVRALRPWVEGRLVTPGLLWCGRNPRLAMIACVVLVGVLTRR